MAAPDPETTKTMRGRVQSVLDTVMHGARPGGGSAEDSCDAISALTSLARLSYAPHIIIDCGARFGGFACAAKDHFPAATIHMIEPQPACASELRRLACLRGFLWHPCALLSSEPGDIPAAVSEPVLSERRDAEHAQITPASTLDRLFARMVSSRHRALLKLDLQGRELEALRGAKALLPKIEIVIAEAMFVRQGCEPNVAELVTCLYDAGFELFGWASPDLPLSAPGRKHAALIFVRSDSALAQNASSAGQMIGLPT